MIRTVKSNAPDVSVGRRLSKMVSVCILGIFSFATLLAMSHDCFADDSKMIIPKDIKPATFLWAGRRIDDPAFLDGSGSPIRQVQLYMDELRQYPDVYSCPMNGAEDPIEFDLLQVRWAGLRSQAAFEVCVFHVANALRDAGLVSDWLSQSGFEIASISRSTLSDGVSIDAIWPRASHRTITLYSRSFLEEWSERVLGSSSITLTIHLDPS